MVGWRIPGNGKPLDARISIEEGQKPLVEFLGRNTFFTELDRKGRLDVPIAPGNYLFTVSAGGDSGREAAGKARGRCRPGADGEDCG